LNLPQLHPSFWFSLHGDLTVGFVAIAQYFFCDDTPIGKLFGPLKAFSKTSKKKKSSQMNITLKGLLTRPSDIRFW